MMRRGSRHKTLNRFSGLLFIAMLLPSVIFSQTAYTDSLRLDGMKAQLSDYREDALLNISEDYNKMGNYKKAFEYRLQFYNLRDSIFTLEKEKLIKELMFRYEKQKDQARILALEHENLIKDLNLKKQKLQRNALLYSCLIALIIAVFLFLYFHQRRKKDRIIAMQRIKQLEEEKKLIAAKMLVEGQEEERKRIAIELHDGLGVLLSATKMQFSSINDSNPENQAIIDHAYKMLEQATGDVRKISHNMMPGLLTRLGFYEAVTDLFDHINDTTKLKADCLINGSHSRIPENSEIMLYRIVQELVNNTLKHAAAKHIILRVDVLPGLLDIIYTDDGIGFDYVRQIESLSHGLKNIQSRVNFLGGRMRVSSAPGEGIKYSILIPVQD